MKQVHCKKNVNKKEKIGYICDLICNGIVTENIKVSLGCSETSAQVFCGLTHNFTIILTHLIINTSMVMNQNCCI